MRRSVFLCALAVAVAVPAQASATLVFSRDPTNPTVWVAGNDGSGARLIGPGSAPKIAPDGLTVAYMLVDDAPDYRPHLAAVPADGSAPPRIVAADWSEPSTFAWSPDSKTIATVTGPERGRERLALIDVATGAQRTVARGSFYGVSFSPAGNQIVYARARSDRFPARSDVYRAAVGGGAPVRLTRDRRSLNPLWGPKGKVVFVKLVDAKRRRYGPKNELYLMSPRGRGVRRLTRTRVAQLLQGLTPTAWSADGKRLLAEFVGQDTSYAETVNPRTGSHRPVVKRDENGFVGADLTADGSTILGTTGGYDPTTKHDIVTIPYGGGPATVLVPDAIYPAWNR